MTKKLLVILISVLILFGGGWIIHAYSLQKDGSVITVDDLFIQKEGYQELNEMMTPLERTPIYVVPVEAKIEATVNKATYAAPSISPAPASPEASSPIIAIPVLNYHGVDHNPKNSLIIEPDKFAQQMNYLKEHQFTPLTLDDFFLVLEGRQPSPPKPILITFDDGYANNYEHAMPILKKHRFPATLFMSPGAVGQDGYLNWNQTKQMHEAGWDVQPHGMTHPHLPKLSAEQQEGEIVKSRKLIEEQLGTKADVFCYPYGEFNKHTLTILKENGFRYAFTIQQGKTTSKQPPLELKRIYVNGKDSLETWSERLK